MEIPIRPEPPADIPRITEVTELAFRQAAHTCGREAIVIAQLRRRRAQGCVLVGDPKFYTRFGSQSDGSLLVPGVPPEVSLSLRFVRSDDHGTALFHAAFLTAIVGEATPSAPTVADQP